MVKNSDVQKEFDMFAEVWKLFKELLPVGSPDNEIYWSDVTNSVRDFMNKHPEPFSKDIVLAVLTEIERRGKNWWE